MRSIQYIILAICAVILFGTVLYFGIRDYEYKEKYRTKEESQIFPISKEPLIVETETSKIGELKPENKQEYQKEVEKGGAKQEINKGSLETIKFIQDEGAITDNAGSLFLKSALKNMACSTTESLPLSISCCGQLLFSEDGSDKNHACLLMDTYTIGEAEDEQQKYRLRLIMGDDLVIYEEVNGFPTADSKCYPLENKSGKEICASINLVALDSNFSDTTGYNSCTFMNFGYGPEVSKRKHRADHQLLGYAENIKCDIDKETIINKGLKTPFSVVLRLKLQPKSSETIKSEGKESTTDSVNQTEIEDGDKKPLQNQNIEKNEKEIVPENSDESQSTGNQHENTNESESGEKLEVVPLSYFSGPLLSLPNSEYSSDDTNSDESNDTFQHDSTSPLSDSVTPDPGQGFTSVFSRILNFIKDHILSIFYSNT